MDSLSNPVLEFENKLLSISQAINGDDYRNQPLRMQTEAVLVSVQKMHDINNTADLEEKIKELQVQIKTLEVTVEKQTSDRTNVQKQVLVLTQQLERNDNLINNLNGVIASYKEKEAIIAQPVTAEENAKQAAVAENNQPEEQASAETAVVEEAPVAAEPIAEAQESVVEETTAAKTELVKADPVTTDVVEAKVETK
ncbi:hypothetical protein [Aliivibrio wodanis]|uniref:hypothetical protein n=1 Tax=Aliivibrio wodanis TaxID=80852 RepID=UPI00406C3AF7